MAKEEMEDSDEDVVLPNSPLADYMRNVYNSDYINLPFLEDVRNQNVRSGLNDMLSDMNVERKSVSVMTSIISSLKSWVISLYAHLLPFTEQVNRYLQNRILRNFQNSKILIAEDMSFLQNWESETLSDVKSSAAAAFQIIATILVIFIFKSLFVDSGIQCLDKKYILFPEYFHLWFHIYTLILKYLFNGILLLLFIFIVMNVIKVLFYINLHLNITKTLNNMQSMTCVIKKSIRLIQEAELIARGFTSASVTAVAERIETASGLPIACPNRQYPELRKCIFTWNKTLFMYHRSATLKILQTVPLGQYFDFSSHAVAMLDLKEFGELLKYDVNSVDQLEELEKVSSGFSITSLKTIYQLMELQMSEFFKYLYLSMSCLISSNHINHLCYLMRLKSTLSTLQKEMTFLLNETHSVYRYYRSMATDTVENNLQLSSRKSHLEVAVHNMSLHLKAALVRLLQAEDHLSKTYKEHGDCDSLISNNSLRLVHSVLKEVKLEVSAYEVIFVECTDYINKLIDGNEKFPVEQINIKTFPNDSQDISKPVKCDVERNIEDEVFEAVVTKLSHEINEKDERNFADEECKRNLEVSSHLMQELKNVLVVKADECRIREQKALAKKKQELGISESPEILYAGSESVDESPMNTCLLGKKKFAESWDTYKNSSYLHDINDFEHDDEDIRTEDSQNTKLSFEHSILDKNDSFASSIAALAAQRKQMLGISPDVCFDNESGNESLSE
ncbi:vezatin-like [Stegodyphus dumicola]|uniref:vezatin-like n=1 Tax=Stegodyphus dumicola TaxID=202533 RepID=UPI0015A822C7|nr:vezatin-like [Stegodyphus dumicola]